MSEIDAGTAKGAGRRAEVFLSPSKKYGIYIQLMRGQTMVGAVAAQAGAGALHDHAFAAGRQAGRSGGAGGLAARRLGQVGS